MSSYEDYESGMGHVEPFDDRGEADEAEVVDREVIEPDGRFSDPEPDRLY